MSEKLNNQTENNNEQENLAQDLANAPSFEEHMKASGLDSEIVGYTKAGRNIVPVRAFEADRAEKDGREFRFVDEETIKQAGFEVPENVRVTPKTEESVAEKPVEKQVEQPKEEKKEEAVTKPNEVVVKVNKTEKPKSEEKKEETKAENKNTEKSEEEKLRELIRKEKEELASLQARGENDEFSTLEQAHYNNAKLMYENSSFLGKFFNRKKLKEARNEASKVDSRIAELEASIEAHKQELIKLLYPNGTNNTPKVEQARKPVVKAEAGKVKVVEAKSENKVEDKTEAKVDTKVEAGNKKAETERGDEDKEAIIEALKPISLTTEFSTDDDMKKMLIILNAVASNKSDYPEEIANKVKMIYESPMFQVARLDYGIRINEKKQKAAEVVIKRVEEIDRQIGDRLLKDVLAPEVYAQYETSISEWNDSANSLKRNREQLSNYRMDGNDNIYNYTVSSEAGKEFEASPDFVTFKDEQGNGHVIKAKDIPSVMKQLIIEGRSNPDKMKFALSICSAIEGGNYPDALKKKATVAQEMIKNDKIVIARRKITENRGILNVLNNDATTESLRKEIEDKIKAAEEELRSLGVDVDAEKKNNAA